MRVWAFGWAVPDYKMRILSNGIGNGIYTIYSKRPRRSKGLIKVAIFGLKRTPIQKKRGK